MDWNVIAGTLLTFATVGAFIFIYRAKPGLRRTRAAVRELDDD